jgi:cytochrome c5
MKIRIVMAIGAIGGSSLIALGQMPGSVAVANQAATSSVQQGKGSASHAVPEDQGERKFRQNCSRCHNAPEELPTRVTGTVLLHMRVRASLSAADERAILRYLAP